MSGFSTHQSAALREIRWLMQRDDVHDPMRLSRSDLAQIFRRSYPQLSEADSKTVAAYVSQNLHSRRFLEALGGDDPAVELRRLCARIGELEREARAIGEAIDAVTEIVSGQL